MNDALLLNLSAVNEWLKFAESKLTVLITVNGAALLAAAQFLTASTLEGYVRLSVLAFISLIFGSLLCGLIGIIPRVGPIRPHSYLRPSPGDNLLFYGTLARYSAADYLTAFAALTGHTSAPTGYEQQVAEQTVINAKISSWKYLIFGLAIRLAFCAVLVCAEILLIGFLIETFY